MRGPAWLAIGNPADLIRSLTPTNAERSRPLSHGERETLLSRRGQERVVAATHVLELDISSAH